MRGGSNKKSLEEHIENGTYRPSLHGIEPDTEIDKLQKMKQCLYEIFIKTKKELKSININTNTDTYKKINDILLDTVKTFYSIVKIPIKTTKDCSNKDKIDINDYLY